jgi:hypothetical protein
MRARKPERVVAVALANKLARIAWAMMRPAKPSEPNFTRRPDDKELSEIDVSVSKGLASATT